MMDTVCKECDRDQEVEDHKPDCSTQRAAITCVQCGHDSDDHTTTDGCTLTGCPCLRYPIDGMILGGAYQPSDDPHAEIREAVETREGNLGEVIDGRVSVYGEVVPAFTRQAQAISAVLNHEVQPWEVPLIMIAIKMIRTTEAPDYSDNSDDIEGYLDIFRQLIGEDMIEARSVKEYVAKRMER